jgi:hypothetical protein
MIVIIRQRRLGGFGHSRLGIRSYWETKHFWHTLHCLSEYLYNYTLGVI